ncbi:hypothetical protein CDD83_10026 [Cordyceps sp. RAO-2017]|nr:hypothetical protein CDD83_10026 [Cordyceps sp. RAO-2017]
MQDGLRYRLAGRRRLYRYPARRPSPSLQPAHSATARASASASRVQPQTLWGRTVRRGLAASVALRCRCRLRPAQANLPFPLRAPISVPSDQIPILPPFNPPLAQSSNCLHWRARPQLDCSGWPGDAPIGRFLRFNLTCSPWLLSTPFPSRFAAPPSDPTSGRRRPLPAAATPPAISPILRRTQLSQPLSSPPAATPCLEFAHHHGSHSRDGRDSQHESQPLCHGSE